MILLVTGGRKYNRPSDISRVFDVLDALHVARPITMLIHGGADGIDTICGDWAISRGVKIKARPIKPGDWDKYGMRAGNARNQKMLDEFNPDLLLAFPGQTGTADMVGRAITRRTPVERIGGKEWLD